MSDKTYINQIGRNLLAAVVEMPKKAELRKPADMKTEHESIELNNLKKLQKFYLGIFKTLSEVNPETLGMPDYKETFPVDKKKYDKCIDRVLRVLLVLYAIGITGNDTTSGFIEVHKKELQDLCKKLKVSAMDNALRELTKLGLVIREEDESKLVVSLENDEECIFGKYHCIYTKHIGKQKPEDTKAICSYFRCDFHSLFNDKRKKIKIDDEYFLTAVLSQEKGALLSEMINILKNELDCRAEEKISYYKGILNGSISIAYKHRRTGRTLVSLDTKAGEITMRLNFTTQTLGKVFQMVDEFPSEVFDNIKQCYCKGKECMGHEGVFIPEAGISFCSHIIKYELRDLHKSTFLDFVKLLRTQHRILVETYVV